jgi:hypothetical protein
MKEIVSTVCIALVAFFLMACTDEGMVKLKEEIKYINGLTMTFQSRNIDDANLRNGFKMYFDRIANLEKQDYFKEYRIENFDNLSDEKKQIISEYGMLVGIMNSIMSRCKNEGRLSKEDYDYLLEYKRDKSNY